MGSNPGPHACQENTLPLRFASPASFLAFDPSTSSLAYLTQCLIAALLSPPGHGRHFTGRQHLLLGWGQLWGWTLVGNRRPGKVQWETRDVKTSTVLAFVAKTVRFPFSASFSFLDFIVLFKYADKNPKTCVSFKIERDNYIILTSGCFRSNCHKSITCFLHCGPVWLIGQDINGQQVSWRGSKSQHQPYFQSHYRFLSQLVAVNL